MTLTPRVEEWRARGADEDVLGHRIHVFRREGEGPLLLLLHGFPSSSYDWRLLLDEIPGRGVLAYDCLGFGLSEKPPNHDYTLVEQADIAVELIQRHHPGEKVFLVGHDMGTSVASELMARDVDGDAGIDIVGAMLFNGSMIQGAASPTLGQRLLRGRMGPVMARLSNEWFFRQQFASIFSEGHPLSDEEAADQWCLIAHDGGAKIGHRLIAYMNERERLAERWHGALRDWEKPLSFTWGMVDPVATMNVLDGVRAFRPEAPVHWLEDIGHYPQIEAPSRLAEALQASIRA